MFRAKRLLLILGLLATLALPTSAGERGLLGLMLQDYRIGGGGDRSTFVGAEVVEVTPGLPAERAGIAPGDVIVAIDEILVESTGHLQVTIAGMAPGSRVEIRLMRRGEMLSIPVRIAGWRLFLLGQPHFGLFSSVVTLKALDAELRIRFGLAPEVEGLAITRVDPDSTYRTILKEGMVIQRINGVKVTRETEVLRLLNPELNRLEILEDGVVGSLAFRGF